ncbi:MAG: protease HtpX [Deltaproteobacteria bacterium RIFCSPLOWO2_12_FULL_43_16]|nr:MAG: protease HtpX [Deltaproteobacteria bacterium GWA2_43_19]OGQ10256.1 MAG: protease HtpX [Deltaproteobacteria bacterium RIFCSPHIGHO2_02_FULL_43_33]OGQ44739.1 MAG: protease HtpX [Deltaproteobacteria bacterium RIFCSPLOWO2_01_FULL_42_9]OGQ57604.1 MAG: protease HtpX [Deltaproteobacteria bacterium RIFCSPLOWO2_12_FULL_43_16]HBR17717.1 zinc metalloprotease HtpX [Deltaproteobacteria bacterium]
MNFFKTTILLAVLTAILVFAGDALGGRSGAMTALIFAGIMNFGAYWFSDKIVLMMYRAKPVTEAEAPDLYAITRDLTMKAGLPMPKVYIMENDTPNAFATGRNPSHAAVATTTGIMRLLSREELSGVIGHELAHIQNRDILISTISATIAGAISYLAHMAQWAAMFGSSRDDERGGNPIALIAMMIVAPLAAMIIQMAISRSREYGADEGGARITGNPLSLANALRKLEYANKRIPMAVPNEATAHMFIVSPLSGGSLLRLFSTHPPIEERIKRLEAMAGGPRY